MTTARGNPLAVAVGPGKLYIADLLSVEPDDLVTPWDADWTLLGYTDTGSIINFGATFEDVMVAEELDPILTLQTARNLTVDFALAELTALNLQRAFNGGAITTPGGLVKFEPPPTGDYTHVMLGHESEDGLRRWVFRKCLQIGSVAIAQQRAPNKATIPMSFRVVKPPNDEVDNNVATFLYIQDTDLVTGS